MPCHSPPAWRPTSLRRQFASQQELVGAVPLREDSRDGPISTTEQAPGLVTPAAIQKGQAEATEAKILKDSLDRGGAQGPLVFRRGLQPPDRIDDVERQPSEEIPGIGLERDQPTTGRAPDLARHP